MLSFVRVARNNWAGNECNVEFDRRMRSRVVITMLRKIKIIRLYVYV